MTDYISREAAISHPFANGQYDHAHANKDFINGFNSYKEWLECLPVADVVARDCFDKILAENDTMREQLAAIGKKPGDSMETVKPVVRGEWKISFLYQYAVGYKCSCCDYFQLHRTRFCPNCGAYMRKGDGNADV